MCPSGPVGPPPIPIARYYKSPLPECNVPDGTGHDAVSPRPSIADERRPQIAEAAVRVIVARGFDGMRLSDVAEEAGVSVGTVQHYFGSREAVLVGAFRHVHASALRRWHAAAEGETESLAAAGRDRRLLDRRALPRALGRVARLLDALPARRAHAPRQRRPAPGVDGAGLPGHRRRRGRRPVRAAGLDRGRGGAVDRADGRAGPATPLDIPETGPGRTRDLLLAALARDLALDERRQRAVGLGQATAASSASATVSPSSGTR